MSFNPARLLNDAMPLLAWGGTVLRSFNSCQFKKNKTKLALWAQLKYIFAQPRKDSLFLHRRDFTAPGGVGASSSFKS